MFGLRFGWQGSSSAWDSGLLIYIRAKGYRLNMPINIHAAYHTEYRKVVRTANKNKGPQTTNSSRWHGPSQSLILIRNHHLNKEAQPNLMLRWDLEHRGPSLNQKRRISTQSVGGHQSTLYTIFCYLAFIKSQRRKGVFGNIVWKACCYENIPTATQISAVVHWLHFWVLSKTSSSVRPSALSKMKRKRQLGSISVSCESVAEGTFYSIFCKVPLVKSLEVEDKEKLCFLLYLSPFLIIMFTFSPKKLRILFTVQLLQ